MSACTAAKVVLIIVGVVIVIALVGAISWMVYSDNVRETLAEQLGPNGVGDDLLHPQPVDLDRYSGSWYEMARLPNSFQKKCLCSRAQYTPPRVDGSVGVLNVCATSDRKERVGASGSAWSVNENNTALRVSFAPSFLQSPTLAGNYWILDIDDNYERAVVGSPDRKYLWFLARDPKAVTTAQYNEMVQKARDKGFDTSQLLRGHCDAFPINGAR